MSKKVFDYAAAEGNKAVLVSAQVINFKSVSSIIVLIVLNRTRQVEAELTGLSVEERTVKY